MKHQKSLPKTSKYFTPALVFVSNVQVSGVKMGCFHKVLPNVKSAYVTLQNFTPDLQKFYTDTSAVSATLWNSGEWRVDGLGGNLPNWREGVQVNWDGRTWGGGSNSPHILGNNSHFNILWPLVVFLVTMHYGKVSMGSVAFAFHWEFLSDPGFPGPIYGSSCL